MSLGVIILAHTHLRRVAQLASYLSSQGCLVVVHIDARVADTVHRHFVEQIMDVRRVYLSPRHACDWAGFSLVEATRDAARLMLEKGTALGHVCLISGSCLPIKPTRTLIDFLADNPDVDFIDCHKADEGAWVRDGLSAERFCLHFPFDYRKQRRLFDASVKIQRALGIKRHCPDGIEPHLGSQWWCLSRKTLLAILNDPESERLDAYFRRSFIPDESYFQTMAVRHGGKIESKSLTFAPFDHKGKPFLFYDDHADGLAGQPQFFARKIWPKAAGLYARFLGRHDGDARPGFEAYLDTVRQGRTKGRSGYLTMGRHPARAFEAQFSTTRRYAVLQGFTGRMSALKQTLEASDHLAVHGRIFGEDAAELPGTAPTTFGNLSAVPALRDRMAAQYLTSLVRNTPKPVVFFSEANDAPRLLKFVEGDANALLIRSDDWPDGGISPTAHVERLSNSAEDADIMARILDHLKE